MALCSHTHLKLTLIEPVLCHCCVMCCLLLSVNLPGYSYDINALGKLSATKCPVDTYSPGMKKQRACVPCPTGFTTKGRTGAVAPTACGKSDLYAW